MPTDPTQINVAYIKHASNDEYSDGIDEIMTAQAIQRLKENAPGTPPTIITFVNADLVNGIYTLPYESGVQIVFLVVVDNNGDEVKVSPYFDPEGNFVEIDFSTLESIEGVWTISVWTATGPNPRIPVNPISGSEADYMRIWGETPVSFMSVADYLLYTVPAQRSFCVRDLNIITTSVGDLTIAPIITLDVPGSTVLINNEPVPQERSKYKPIPWPVQSLIRPVQMYPNHRYNFQIKESEDTVLTEGQILRLRITSPANVIGDSLIALVNVMGYLV